MSSNNILSQRDEEIPTSYLLGKKFEPGTLILINSSEQGPSSVNLRKFSYFKSNKDLLLTLTSSKNLLLVAVGIISGQESKFGVLNLETNNWQLKKYLPFEEIVAGAISSSINTVFYGSYTYRFSGPPIYRVYATHLDRPDLQIELDEVSTREKTCSTEVGCSLLTGSDKHTIKFFTHGEVLTFSTEKLQSEIKRVSSA